MPEPIPDLSRDQQCHHYQAPSGQRCGSPALKSEYYCFHHLVRLANRKNHRVLIDPEITCMEIPVIEDRASIFVALAAVIHRLAENTIDTRRAGQMIYGLQVAMRALEPPPSHRCRTAPAEEMKPAAQQKPAAQMTPAAQSISETQSTAAGSSTTDPASTTPCQHPETQPATDDQQPPRTIQITKESLLYFLRSRHCYNCNTELFPANQLTERPHPGAPPEIIEEARHALPAPQPLPVILPTLNAAASNPRTSNLIPRSCPQSTFAARFALHSPRRSVSLRLGLSAPVVPAPSIVRPHRILNQKINRRTKWQQ